MAIGDKAAAHGLPVEPSTGDIRLGYQAVNRGMDALADQMDIDDARFDALEAPGAWIEVKPAGTSTVNPPAYRNGFAAWTQFGNQGVAYRVRPGVLFFGGSAIATTATTGGAILFTLPPGARPTRRALVPIAGGPGFVEVESDGAVHLPGFGSYANGTTFQFTGSVVIN